jgi:hypothetical protein
MRVLTLMSTHLGIRKFRKRLGLPDPEPAPLVGGTDPDLDSARLRIRILPSSSKNSKKNLYFYCFVTSL